MGRGWPEIPSILLEGELSAKKGFVPILGLCYCFILPNFILHPQNYFESTDGIVWVVDSVDTRRLDDCRRELHALIEEERLVGASVLVLANKVDLPGAASLEDIRERLVHFENLAEIRPKPVVPR